MPTWYLVREAAERSWGIPGKMPDPVYGSREGFPEGPFCCKLKDVTVSQGKGAARDKNPYRVHSKSKAERGEEITEFAVSSPSTC